jgi:hypothetical protein
MTDTLLCRAMPWNAMNADLVAALDLGAGRDAVAVAREGAPEAEARGGGEWQEGGCRWGQEKECRNGQSWHWTKQSG